MENEKSGVEVGKLESGKGQINQSRRVFTRIGVGTPVLMTLASQPVFGAQCLSNILSGNLSDPNRGACYFGWSPGGWMNPGGSAPDWSWTCYDYGTFSEGNTYENDGGQTKTCDKNGSESDGRCYSGGTTLDQTPLAVCFSGETRPLREILLDDNGSLLWKSVAALLNASIGQCGGPPGFQYILTVDQLTGLLCSIPEAVPLPPGFSDVGDFLSWTWEGGPEGGM